MGEEILTRCGYRCDLCLAYSENVKKEDRRKLLSDGWHKYFGIDIKPHEIICDGCLKGDCNGNKLLDNGCPVRHCVIDKGLENCSQCDEFQCPKIKERLVDFEELKMKHGKIHPADRKLFISAYENGKRLCDLRATNGQFPRMANKDIVPDVFAMSKFIGNELSVLWDNLIEFIRSNYKGIENIVFGGSKYGWAYQYKQNKSKTLFTLYPERKAFTMLIVYGKRQLEIVEENRNVLSDKTNELLSSIAQLHDGKWIWYRVKEEADIKDLHILMKCKKQPKNNC
jgi:Protein of unknown function (DUF3788)/Protein of unknown function (DUF3795)